jgi:hypothetical protein
VALIPGTRLGVYEILAAIGEGGMSMDGAGAIFMARRAGTATRSNRPSK